MKKNNKGFSLVELIIVIAIMAILAGAIAPALIKYIDKSRRSNDVTSAKAIKTAVETALGTESYYELLTTGTADAVITVTPGKSTSSGSGGSDAVSISVTSPQTDTDGTINGKTVEALTTACEKSIATTIGEKTPKLKYRKNATDPKGKTGANDVPTKFVATVTKGGTVTVYIASNSANFTSADADNTGKAWEISPNMCEEYQ
ncbi:MAG: type II secretion system protein [Lachnospiraceae bacterium]|nr:type II secretion system protein [Lachnospiraceae bacterium]